MRSSLLVFFFGALAIAACSKSSDSAASAASAVPVWPTLPADPVDAMTAADEDPNIKAYARKAGDTLTARFRDCMDQALTKNSKLAGSVVMVADVKGDGTVASAQPIEQHGLDAGSVKCIAKVVSAAHFPPPPADHTLIKLPFVLNSER